MSLMAVKMISLQFNTHDALIFPKAPQNLLCLDFHKVLCCVCSLQPGGVQSEHLPHLCGADPSSEPGPVLRLQWRVSDLLEFSGRVGNRALPDAAPVHFSNGSSSILVDLFERSPHLSLQVFCSRLLHRSGPSGGDHGQYCLWKAGGH